MLLSMVDINPYVNSNLQTYTHGADYPAGGTSLTVAGVAFTLANYPGGGTGIVQTQPASQSSPSSFDIPVNIADPTNVYTLINSAYGAYGDTVGAVEFKATGGLDDTVNLVEGQDIRDHNNDGYNNTIGQGALGGIYRGTAYFGGGQVRLDEQAFTLPSSFQSATLTDIILHGYGDNPIGQPFLAAATVTTSPAGALPTLTALRASTTSAATGQSLTFTATVSDLSPGGAIPNGGTVTFSDQAGAIGSAPLIGGVAEFATSILSAGADTITASYGGAPGFDPSHTGTIVTAAGTGTAGYTGNNGPATGAELNGPWGLAFDSAGDLFIADSHNNVVREIVKATGDIITVAGNGTAGYSGNNGPATAAELHNPNSVAVDSAGDVFISDSDNNVVREVVKATGDIIAFAGNGTAGYSGNSGPATAAELRHPNGVAFDSAGDLFIADGGNNVIREVVQATGDIITVAGNGSAGYRGDNGPATAAELDGPDGVAVDSAGDLFIADSGNNVVREVVQATGDIITFAGNGTAGYGGDTGPATAAELDDPNGLAVDSAGDLFIADFSNNVIREVLKATGDIITVAGIGTAGYSGDGGPAATAQLNVPGRVAVNSAGDLFIADYGNNVVREVTPAVTVTIGSSSALPTLTALVASTASAALGQSVTFTATVNDLSPGGPTPNWGTVTFSDQSGPLGSAILATGVAEFTTSSLPAGVDTITASYSGTAQFAPSTTGTIVTAAGNGTAGYAGDNGPATAAELNVPRQMAFDTAGDLFIADTQNNVIREVVKATGKIITVAGDGIAGYSGDGGPATAAELKSPIGLAIDSAGDLFIADDGNNRIREVVAATGKIITVAGDGTAGYNGDGGLATAAELNGPNGVAVDSAGNLFVADCSNNRIREVVKSSGDIITVAGNGTAGYSGDGGPATAAKLNFPVGLAIDSAGDLFIADQFNNRVREVVKSSGHIITVAGNGTFGYSGDGGPATAAELNLPLGVAVDSAGDLFIADFSNNVVREVVKATGDIVTVAGNGTAGYSGDNGPATAAELYDTLRVGVDPAGQVFEADGDSVIREFTPAVTVTVSSSSALPTLTAIIASTASAALGQSVTFIATVSDLSAGGATPNGGTVTFSDRAGTLGSASLVDGLATYTTTTLAAGADTVTASYGGTADFAPSSTGTIVRAAGDGVVGYTGDNGPATAAELNSPEGMAFDSAGDLIFADDGNNVVREVVKATGQIITIAGNGIAGYSGDGGPATSAELNDPRDVAVDSAGNVFIADLGNNVIREVVAATGEIITVAGDGIAGYSGDGGPATAAELNGPRGITVDSAGDLFFADSLNNRIREVVKATGNIITVAGDGIGGYSGDGGPATAAEINAPVTVAVDLAGDVFFADSGNNRIREVVKATGKIMTIAGNGTAGYSGDGGPATAAELNGGNGIAIDALGDVFIADGPNNRVREVVKATGDIITVAGDGTAGYSGDGGLATAAALNGPYRVAVDSAGDLFVADAFNDVIREVTPAVTVTISPSSATTDLVMHVEPSATATAGAPFNPQPVIWETDSNGDLETNDNSTVVTASVIGGGGRLQGTTSVTVSGGIATFSNLVDDTAGTITLVFTSSNLSTVMSSPIQVAPAPASQLIVKKPPSHIVAGIGFPLEVDAYDPYQNLATSFNGAVTLSVATGAGSLTGTVTMNAADGVAQFPNVFSDTSGSISIGASASSSGTNIASPPSAPVVVGPGAVDHFVLTTNFQDPDVAGTTGTVTVVAEDHYDNPVNSGPNLYVGTIDFVSSDPRVSGLPASYMFTAQDAGAHTFTNVILETAGSQTITATDSASSGVHGQVSVDVVPSQVHDFLVTTNFPSPDVAGTVGTVTVTAEDQYGNTAGSGPNQYEGTVDLVSTDPKMAGLPDSYMFIAGDAGIHTFTDVVLETAGSQTITATDSVTSSVNGQLSVDVVPGQVHDFVVTTNFPSPDPAGTVGTVTVTAEDQYGNIDGSGPNQYQRTVDLASTDPKTAGLPNSYMFTAMDAGIHTFSNVILETAGSQTITATDSVTSSVNGQVSVNVVPGQVHGFVVTTSFPSPDVAGTAGSVTVTAVDQYGNTAGSGPNQYEGTVKLVSTDPKTAGLPNSYMFIAGDAGTHTFSNAILETAGNRTITATDTMISAINGQVSVNVVAGQVHGFAVKTNFPNPDPAGTVGTITVTAEDKYGNAAGSGPNQYEGTVDLVSTDPKTAGLPTSYTFTAGDAGAHTFSNVILETAGNQTITAIDSVTSTVTGQAAVNVIPGQVYDFVVTTNFPSPDPAGTVGTVTVTAKDKYGNTAGTGPDQYEGTVDLVSTDSKSAGLPTSYTLTASDAGSHTFTNVMLETAGSQTIRATDSVNSAVVGSYQGNVTALAAAKLAVVAQPPGTIGAAAGFGFQIAVEDVYGNIVTAFPGTLTVVIGTNPGGGALSGTATATPVAGIAQFSGLALSKVGVGYTLKVSSGSLTPAATQPFKVTGVAPTVKAEYVKSMSKLNKKGQPQGKPIAWEFVLQYSAPMSATAALEGNYQIEAATTKHGETTYTPVGFSATYNKAKNTITLTVSGKNPFAKGGGRITITATGANGVSSLTGVLLNPKYKTFTIANGATSITLA